MTGPESDEGNSSGNRRAAEPEITREVTPVPRLLTRREVTNCGLIFVMGSVTFWSPIFETNVQV